MSKFLQSLGGWLLVAVAWYFIDNKIFHAVLIGAIWADIIIHRNK